VVRGAREHPSQLRLTHAIGERRSLRAYLPNERLVVLLGSQFEELDGVIDLLRKEGRKLNFLNEP
jgi:hypothetical protein